MRAVIDQFTDLDEVGLVGFGQSNRLPRGDRDSEGFVQAPHLSLRAGGLDLTIWGVVPALSSGHGAAGTRSIVTVAEALVRDDWTNGELRLIHAEYGDAIFTTRRKGHAKVLGNQAHAITTIPATAFDLTNEIITWVNHGRQDGSVVMMVGGTLPTGVSEGEILYVRDATQHNFKVTKIPHGSPVGLGGTPVDVVLHALPYLYVEWQSEVLAPTVPVTFANAGDLVTHTAHNLTEGSIVVYTGGTPPPEVSLSTPYFVRSPTANTYRLSATQGGTLLTFTADSSGTITATPGMLAFVSGYVHLHDRFTFYDNVQVVTPYIPAEPGPYPTGTPVLPGITLDADVLAWSDLALVLPYTFNEGIEGEGHAGTCTVAALVVTITGGLTLEANLFAGGFIKVANSKARIVSNTTSTVTVDAWVGGTPAAGTQQFELHLGHHKNNPHHYTAGEGFLYPNGNSQPGGSDLTIINGPTSPLGQIYSRPRDRLVGSYVKKTLASQPMNVAGNAAGLARIISNASGQFQISPSGGKLRIARTDTDRHVLTGKIQFEDFVRPGHIIRITNGGQTPSVDGVWRVDSLKYTDSTSGGSWIDCVQLDGSTQAVPTSPSGTEPSGMIVQREYRKELHAFGSLIECAWRLSNAIGKRIVCTSLGINSAGTAATQTNNETGFSGQIGWWDDDLDKDWTPSNPDGVAARMKRLLGFMASRAVHASLGATQNYKVLALDGWGFEGDTLQAARRELASQTVPTQIQWLRGIIDDAGLNPYPRGARVPVQLAQLPTIPWVVGFDQQGVVNAAISRAVLLEGGFMASVDTNGSPIGGDGIHFSGVGEAINGKLAAQALLPMIQYGFLFAMGEKAVEIGNGALNLIGDAPNITQLEPEPNDTMQAELVADQLPKARDLILQRHAWTFATVRITAVLLSDDSTDVDHVPTWLYAYALPADMLHPIAVLDPNGTDDVQVGAMQVLDQIALFRAVIPTVKLVPASQPHTIETNRDGYKVLRTNQANAVFIYASKARPFDLWDPMALAALEHRLAYQISGGTVKATTGIKVAIEHLRMSEGLLAQATQQNAEWQRDKPALPRCPWLP